MKKAFFSFLMLATFSATAFAAGTSVLGGDATLTGATRAALNAGSATDTYAQFVANAGAKSAVLDWSKFNIGSGKEMNFSGAGTTFFNLVDGAASKSQIDGLISGNGSVWVINPSGIAFGANSQVNVEGVFAASAGNLSNADALRNGTSTLPTFSSFAGEVSSASGSRFTADQVALMGKTVSAAGDFTGARMLTVTASSGAMTVDDVAGGKVSVNLGDFAVPDAEVSLGDLDVGGTLVASSAGTLNVTKDVATKTGAALSAAGDIAVSGDATAETGGICVQAYSGGITVDGRVSAADPETGFVYANAAQASGSTGNITVNGIVESGTETLLGAGYDFNGSLTGGKGGVSVGKDALVLGEYGSTYVWAAGGDGKGVDIAGEVRGYRVGIGSRDASGVVAQEGAKVTAGFEYGGRMIYPGQLSVQARSGDIDLDAATVTAGTASLQAVGQVSAGNAANDFSDIVAASGTRVEIRDATALKVGDIGASEADVVLTAGGTVTGSGTLSAANGTVRVESTGGNVSMNGQNGAKIVASKVDVTALGYADLQNAGNEIGELSLTAAMASVWEKDGVTLDQIDVGASLAVSATGDIGETEDGAVKVGGLATFNGNDSSVELKSGKNAFSSFVIASGSSVAITDSGTLDVAEVTAKSGDVTLKSADGSVSVSKGAFAKAEAGTVELSASKNIVVRGTVEAGGDVRLSAEEGSDLVYSDGRVTAGENISLRAGYAVQNAGTLDAASGDVTVRASGDVNLANGTDAVLKAGNLDVVSDSEVLAGGVAVDITGVVDIEGRSVGISDVNGVTLGNVKATDGGVTAYTGCGDIRVAKGRTVSANGTAAEAGKVSLMAGMEENARGNVIIDGTVAASDDVYAGTRHDGDVTVSTTGRVTAKDEVSLVAAGADGTHGDVRVDGSVSAEGSVSVGGGIGVGSTGGVVVNGTVRSSKSVELWGGSLAGGVELNGTVDVEGPSAMATLATGFEDGAAMADIIVNGSVRVHDTNDGKGTAMLWAGIAEKSKGGDIRFGASGHVSADSMVEVLARHGDVTQDGVAVQVCDGRTDRNSFRPSVSSGIVRFVVGGNVGQGEDGYVAVDGKVIGFVDENASIAAAKGGDFVGGEYVSRPPTISLRDGTVVSVDWGKGDPNSTIVASGDLSIYTCGRLGSSGLLYADGNLNVSAASFGNVSYLRAGGTLTINNVGKPANPQIAYFETVNGVEPNINNQPNDTVIFVDGRLAGGNLKILNQFGANEAFMVSTPELKSTQGIFGNPTFLHSDLDVANPMEVSAIDYMLQETPRLTLDKDFPAEVDSHVDSVVVPEKDSIQFGRNTKDEPTTSEGKVAETATADGRVAMAKHPVLR